MDDSATLHLVGLRELVARACAETVVVRHGLLICSSLVTLRAAEGHASVRFRKLFTSVDLRNITDVYKMAADVVKKTLKFAGYWNVIRNQMKDVQVHINGSNGRDKMKCIS